MLCYIATRDLAQLQNLWTPPTNNELFRLQFSMAEIHRSSKPNEDITFYPKHRDKVGNLVIFCQTCGDSFVFVVYPCATQAIAKTKCDIDRTVDCVSKKTDQGNNYCSLNGLAWREYDAWRGSLFKKQMKCIVRFEVSLKKGVKGPFGIRVYRMRAGDCLVFPASYHTHDSILPPQKPNAL